jgi:hypothetical protein
MHDYELDSLTTVAHEAGLRRNIAMHRVAMLRPVILHAQRNVPNAMAQPLAMHCQSASCVLELWVGYSSSLHGRGQALSARTGVLRVQPPRAEISPFDLLVGDAAVCMSAADPASTRHIDDADNMCSPGSRSHSYSRPIIQLISVTIEIDLAGHAGFRFSIAVTVQWTTASIARSCSDPLNQVPESSIRSQQTSSYCPFVSDVSVATGGC